MTVFQLVAAQENDHEAVLLTPKGAYHCKVAYNGIGHKEKEGDGIIPIGQFPIRQAFYRKDRLKDIKSNGLPIEAIAPDYGWCDDVAHDWYNRHIRLPFDGACDMLWQEDGRYDLALVVGFNDAPVVAGKGSALFIHVDEDQADIRQGGIALALPDLLDVLAQCEEHTEILIQKP